jgi:hypothetical protein
MVGGEIKTEERELRMKKRREWKRISMLGEGRKIRLYSENKKQRGENEKIVGVRRIGGAGKGVWYVLRYVCRILNFVAFDHRIYYFRFNKK